MNIRSNAEIGANLKALRVANRLSQKDIAELIAGDGVEMTQAMYSTIETARRTLHIDEAQAVADVYGIEIVELLAPNENALAKSRIALLSAELEQLKESVA